MERRPGRLGAIDMMRAMDVPTLASTAAATGSAGLAPASSRQQPFEGGPGTIPSRLASVTATNQTDAAQLRGSTISLVPPGTAGQPTPSGATALLPLDSAKPQFLQTQSPLPPIHSSTTPLSSDALSLESPVSAFRSFHSSIPHPATVLNLVADESDRQVFTEFDELCNELLSTLGDLEASVEEMTIWKDDFLTQSVPSNVKLQVTLLFARLFRSKSEMHEPLFELLKQVRLYSRPWMNKRFALMELEKDYNSQTHVLDVAVRKMEQLQYQIQRLRSEKRVSLWDRLCRAMLEKFIGVPANEAGGNEQHTEAATKVVIDHEESRPQKAKESRPNSACSIKTEDNVKSGARESKAKKRGRKKSSEPTQNNDNIGSIKENTSMRRDESIFPYGQETPSWQQSNQAGKNSSPVRRTPLVHFEILLHEFFPDVIRHLTRLHRKPFPSPPSIRYVSLHASEAVPVVRKRLPKNMPRSWSIPSFTDIRRLRASADRGGRRARWRLGDGTVVWDAHRGEANKPVAAATRPAMSPPRATRRLRSNSTGILPELRFSDVKLSFAQAIADAGLAAGENVEPDKNFGVRSRPRPLGARKAELYEASNTSSNDDESVSAASDFEVGSSHFLFACLNPPQFLAEFDETMLEETMGKFLEVCLSSVHLNIAEK
ncbi:hypothetical protein DFJ73DRAFT_279145 [Zopfochytrium polystomum]|nr:hypothetical protein DFJ73DRAFT_279145 [Zopfochytrium polystomum]